MCQSQRRGSAAGDRSLDGAARERGFFASLTDIVKAAVSDQGNSPAPTADTVIGAGLR